ncbi:hypothetical protein BDQ12DRAFT_670092 [Crucibulum laeve]|uniref:Uncharacterized protein n=1 Tax=Crucibulum laeve TaxID=68775 RepID=A0A5C3LKN1_9AGAR|nr:hypothetical protein BDQ12DRAFT_670092 [Crucibulum laeve]
MSAQCAQDNFGNLNDANIIELFHSESDKTSICLGHGKKIFKTDELSALLISEQLEENRLSRTYDHCKETKNTESADNGDAEYLSVQSETDSKDSKDNIIPFNDEKKHLYTYRTTVKCRFDRKFIRTVPLGS